MLSPWQSPCPLLSNTHFIFNILKKGCGHNQLGQQVAAILTPVFTRTHFCSQTWNDLVPGCKLLMALTDLFLSGVASSLEPVLWRTSSSTNKLRRNRCRNSRDRKCSQQWKNISQILRNPENESVQKQSITEMKSVSFSSFVLRMQRIRSKQQKYKYGHKISESSKESPAVGAALFTAVCFLSLPEV